MLAALLLNLPTPTPSQGSSAESRNRGRNRSRGKGTDGESEYNLAMQGYAELPIINRPFGRVSEKVIEEPAVSVSINEIDDDIIAILLLMD